MIHLRGFVHRFTLCRCDRRVSYHIERIHGVALISAERMPTPTDKSGMSRSFLANDETYTELRLVCYF